MAPKLSRTVRYGWPVLCALAALTTGGCQPEEGVHSYDAPKPPAPIDRPLNRILGAFFTLKDATWSFKLVGPAQLFEKDGNIEKEFRAFLDSVRFNDGQVEYQPARTWIAGPPVQGRYATFLIGPKDGGLELTVYKLDGGRMDDQKLLDNINRWRLQLDLAKVGKDDAINNRKPLEVAGVKGVLVDLTGPGSGKTNGAMAMPGARHPRLGPPAASPERIAFKKPEPWNVESDNRPPDKQAMFPRDAAYQVIDGKNSVHITVMSFPGEAGGLPLNIDRWAAQELGLPRLTEDQMLKVTRETRVAGGEAAYVDLLGPEGPDRKRTLAIMIPRPARNPTRTWFVKMTGSAGLVEREKGHLDEFLKSIQFEGGR